MQLVEARWPGQTASPLSCSSPRHIHHHEATHARVLHSAFIGFTHHANLFNVDTDLVARGSQYDEGRVSAKVRRAFSTQCKCGEYLRRLRWPSGVMCPRCGTKHLSYIRSRRLWQCRACRYRVSVITGTIFHRSKSDLPRWFVAIWLMCNSPKGISAKQLERDLGVHYETAWYMAQRIRRAMKRDIFESKLCGIVEIDDAVMKSGNGTRWEGGSYVLGMASRSGDIKLQTQQASW